MPEPADGPLTAFTGGVGLFEQGHIFRQSCVRLGAGALQASSICITHTCSVFSTSQAPQRCRFSAPAFLLKDGVLKMIYAARTVPFSDGPQDKSWRD